MILSDQRQGYRANMIGDDEPFELFKGFAEIFVTVGLGLLMSGLLGLSALFGEVALIPFFAMILSVALAFYFTRKRRMSLPSIALCISFALSLGACAAVLLAGGGQIQPWEVIVVGLVGMVGLAAYYRIFRLPFAMFALGAFGIVAMLGVVELLFPSANSASTQMTDYFDLHRQPYLAIGTLIFGILAFIAALLGTGLAIGVLALFTLLAIIIDRRSFLTAGLIYMGLLLAAAISETGTDWAPVLTILTLGVFVTTLGAFWTQIRAGVLGVLPNFPGKDRLPPYEAGLAVSE